MTVHPEITATSYRVCCNALTMGCNLDRKSKVSFHAGGYELSGVELLRCFPVIVRDNREYLCDLHFKRAVRYTLFPLFLPVLYYFILFISSGVHLSTGYHRLLFYAACNYINLIGSIMLYLNTIN